MAIPVIWRHLFSLLTSHPMSDAGITVSEAVITEIMIDCIWSRLYVNSADIVISTVILR